MKKDFSIDWDNPSDIKKHISMLQIRRKLLLRKLGYNEITFNNSKYNLDNIFPEINKLYNSIQIEKGDYYVYFHCNPLIKVDIRNSLKDLFLATNFNINYLPFYVGKGKGTRYLDLNRNDSHRKLRTSLHNLKLEIIPIKVIEGISENSALTLENFYMYFLGLKALTKDGYLCNLSENNTPELDDLINSSDIMKSLVKKNKISKFMLGK